MKQQQANQFAGQSQMQPATQMPTDFSKMQQQSFAAQMQSRMQMPPNQTQFAPQQFAQQPLLYENMEVDKLAQILQQNPNIAISAQKRAEVENYTKQVMQYQQQQLQA